MNALESFLRQLDDLFAAAILSVIIMAVPLACGAGYLWLAQHRGQSTTATGIDMRALVTLVPYMLILAGAVIGRLRKNPHVVGIMGLFLTPPLFLCGVAIQIERIPYFGQWLWVLTLISMWILLNIPRGPSPTKTSTTLPNEAEG